LEAWASRTPVVIADIGALRTLVRHDVDGLLVPPSQPELLANALQRLLDDPAFAHHLGERGRVRVGDMTWDRQAGRFEEVVDSLASDSGHSVVRRTS
jgi:glycogen(starch) synthase